MLLIAIGANASAVRPGPDIEVRMQRSREALFQGRYADTLRLTMEILIEHPEQKEARELMRECAKRLAELQTREVQEERRRLLEEARRTFERKQEEAALAERRRKELEADRETLLLALERSRPEWTLTLSGRLARRDYLEAYEWIFEVLDQFPDEEWGRAELVRLERSHDRMRLGWRPDWYRDAVEGYRAFAAERWAQAHAHWSAALEAPEDEEGLPRALLLRLAAEAKAKAPKEKAPAVVAGEAESAETAESARGKAARSAARRLLRLGKMAVAVAQSTPVAPKPAPAKAAWPAAPKKTMQEIDAMYVRGLVQYGLGDVKGAAATWQEVLRADPAHPSAKRALERARHELEGKR